MRPTTLRVAGTAEQAREQHTNLTPELIDRLAATVRDGCHRATAARLVGVASSVLCGWCARGERESATDVSAEGSLYVALFLTLNAAEAEVEMRAVSAWLDAAAHDWRAAAEFLTRRFPERWARGRTGGPTPEANVVHEVHLAMGGPLEDYLFPVDGADGQ